MAKRQTYRGDFFTVSRRTVDIPGRGRRQIDVIEHPPCATIVPIDDRGRVVMIRQFRPVLGEWLWELPAGKIDAGEDAEAGARRELEEETGMRAGTMTWLCGFYPSPGSMTEWMDVWVARALTRSRAHRDADEVIRVKAFSTSDVSKFIESGKIKDAKSLVGLLAWFRSKGFAYIKGSARFTADPALRSHAPLRAAAKRGGHVIKRQPEVPPAPRSRTARSASSSGRRR